MKLIQMIRDNIAIQSIQKEKQEANITERFLVGIKRREEKKNQGILQGDGNRIDMFKNMLKICLIVV